MGKPEVRTPASWSCSMKPGDLVRHKKNKTVHLVTAVREIKGEVRYVHLSDRHQQQVFYLADLELISEAR